jgi:hypothetical protein
MFMADKSTKLTDFEISEEVFDPVVEEERAEYRGTLEPFEIYAARKKKQLQKECKEYVGQLQHGYDVIIESIRSDSKTG